jgi:hypothetical protein
MENTELLIILGGRICLKLKHYYFRHLEWVQCYKDVANLFTRLKCEAKKFYSDKTELELMTILCSFSEQDIRDGLDGISDKEG